MADTEKFIPDWPGRVAEAAVALLKASVTLIQACPVLDSQTAGRARLRRLAENLLADDKGSLGNLLDPQDASHWDAFTQDLQSPPNWDNVHVRYLSTQQV